MSILQTTSDSLIVHSQQDLICLPHLISMDYYLYMYGNNINLISNISSMFYIYLILKFYYLGSPQNNILCIRVANIVRT